MNDNFYSLEYILAKVLELQMLRYSQYEYLKTLIPLIACEENQ